MKYKCIVAVLLAVVLCMFSGCTSLGTDIALQLRPPKAMGEQGAAEEALSAYVSANMKREDYTLKYPRGGAYRSAFLMEDLDGDGVNEAIAFLKSRLKPGQTVMVDLMAAQGRESFYVPFGFRERPYEGQGAGMTQWIKYEE